MTAETLPAYDMSLADHGFEPIEIKGLTYPLGEHVPGYGEIYPLAPDMGWTRMPVPGNLNHINIWLLDDRDEPLDPPRRRVNVGVRRHRETNNLYHGFRPHADGAAGNFATLTRPR